MVCHSQAMFSKCASMLLLCCLLFVQNNGFMVSNFTQPLDHFRVRGPYAHVTFQQQYAVYDDNWGGAKNKSPILVFFGGKTPITSDVGHVGIITEAAPLLRALVVFIEHRFYGTSVPYGSINMALSSSEVRSFLTSRQALADFADLIVSLKKNLSALESPVIVMGCSYGGMLAAWFRIKYPHIAIGAVSSSAPILFLENYPPHTDFCSIMSRDFKQINEKCWDIIRQSWDTIDKIASRIFGISVLSKTFNLCSPLLSSLELKKFLAQTYLSAAQYNGRNHEWINLICDTMARTPTSDTGLEAIAAAVTAIYSGKEQSCVNLNFSSVAPLDDPYDHSTQAWNWQACSEIHVHKSCAENNSMLIPREAIDDRSENMQYCLQKYTTLPQVPSYYGGLDLIKGGSHIIFSNGLMDPYSSLGILNDVSGTILAINTEEGSECLDMNPRQEDDPEWLKDQRKKELHILKAWINGGTPKIPKDATAIIPIFMIFLLSFI